MEVLTIESQVSAADMAVASDGDIESLLVRFLLASNEYDTHYCSVW